jgi:hypothetical protein
MQLVPTPKATDGTLYEVTVDFIDEDRNAVAPDSLTWSLTNELGVVINGRYQVSVSVPLASTTIKLMGDDIARANGEKFIITFESLYTSSTYGEGQELNDQATFDIADYTPVIAPAS